MNYQSGVFELTKTIVMFSKQTISEMLKISIKVYKYGYNTYEFIILISSCLNGHYQPLIIVMSKNKYTERYRFGLKSMLGSR